LEVALVQITGVVVVLDRVTEVSESFVRVCRSSALGDGEVELFAKIAVQVLDSAISFKVQRLYVLKKPLK
jgi:hypothetical protein